MLMMFERGMRGGITQSIHRYAHASNKYMSEEFDKSIESSYIQYLDANNLYRWAMSQPLPTGGFRWADVLPEQVPDLSKSYKGYLPEVDVKYPDVIHDSHNELPFLCERLKINGVEKLTPNLYDKKRYVIHIRALMQALNHGLILERIHRAIQFEQSAWMKPYIDFDTQLKSKSWKRFREGLFQTDEQFGFGKTMENIRKYRNIKLVTDREKFLKTVMKPNFKSSILFRENIMGLRDGSYKSCYE